MLNVIARLAVEIHHLPEWEVDWSDTRPQRSRQSLTISDFLKRHVPSQQPLHPVQKTRVVPMSILFRDEVKKSKTVDILSQYIADAQLSGDHQVIDSDIEKKKQSLDTNTNLLPFI